jgi:HlyD family type I secretion membrane fusion protein
MLIGCPSLDQWHKDVPRSVRWPTILGFAVLMTCGLGFGVWASTAPLNGAVVTSGTFVATGQNKQVQHLEGGIIREVLVKEGDIVESNQTLMRLDETAAVAKLRRLQLRKYRLLTTQARLDAEISGKDAFEMPVALKTVATDPEVATIYTRQRAELRARIAKRQAEESVLRKEIAGLEESITGYEAQIRSTEQRQKLFSEELQDKTVLLNRQLIRKTEILALQRAEASLGGELGELTGRMADAKERIARAEQQITSLNSTATQKAVEELREAETELDDIQEQIRAASDVVDRTDIRAPVRGVVVKLLQHTRGGVVAPGSVILELLPINDELIIEARINPSDVQHVKEGQDALVRLTALNQRLTPMIDGRLIYLSADAIAEQEGRNTSTQRRDSFVVRIKLDENDAHRKAPHFTPTPGMPADIFIKTEQRTFFEYIMRPVLDSFSRAFRES